MDPSTYLSRVLSSSSYSGRSFRSLGDALWDKLGKKLFEHQFLDTNFLTYVQKELILAFFFVEKNQVIPVFSIQEGSFGHKKRTTQWPIQINIFSSFLFLLETKIKKFFRLQDDWAKRRPLIPAKFNISFHFNTLTATLD